MNSRALTLSLVMGLIAFIFVQSYVSSIEEEQKKRYGTEVSVIVAKKDIKEMDSINDTMLSIITLPKKFVEPGAKSLDDKDLDDKKTAQAFKEFIGSVAIVPIQKGEQITYNKITDPSIRTGLSPQIAPGRRAISLPVDELAGVSKLVKPGDRIDLIAVLDGGGQNNKIAKTILQDIVILSIGRYVTNNVARVVEPDLGTGREKHRSLTEDFSFNSVSLEVDPSQAQMIALILANGDSRLVLSLRNNDDVDRSTLAGVTMIDVLGADAGRVKNAAKK